MHYYKFNIADWSLGTAHLSLVEEAIYFRLINFYYDSEQPLPLETQSVFRRLRMASESVIAQQIIDEFFTKTDKGYIHERCDVLLKEYRKTAKNNRSNGAKGGRPKKDAAFEETQPKPSGFPPETQQEPEHNPNQEPLTTNQEPLTNLKEIAPQADADSIIGIDDSAPEKQKKELAPKFKPESLTDQMPPALADWWVKWVDYRRARKLSTKEPTWRAQANNLSEWGKRGHDPCQAIKSSIENGWSGLFEPKPKHVGVNHAGQPKSPIERFMQQHYPDAGSGFENDQRPVGGNDGFVRGAVDSELRGSAGQVGTVAPDLIGDFSRTDS